MKKYLVLLITIVGLQLISYAQVAINNDGTTADESAQLEIKSTSKGILIPRLTQAQRNAMIIPAESLLIFQTDNTPGFYYFDGIDWLMLSTSAAAGESGWELTGNAGTNPSNNFVGTIDSLDLIFRVNNVEKLRLKVNGALEPLNCGNSVFVGEGAGVNDDLIGNESTFVGFYAGNSNTLGTNNTAIGSHCLYNSTTGHHNTAVGERALYNNGGSNNIAIGRNPLYYNTLGSNNISIGGTALHYNTTGNSNIAIGGNSMNLNTTGIENIAIGHDALFRDTTGYGNTAVGGYSLNLTRNGYRNTALGQYALYSNETGDYNTAVGYSSGPSAMPGSYDLVNTTAIGNGSTVTASNTIHLGNTSITEIAGQVGFSTYSDKRFKKNVKENIKGLDFILKLKPVSYQWDIAKLDKFLGNDKKVQKDESLMESRKNQEKIVYSGFLAQDVENVVKETVSNFSGVVVPQNENSLYSIRYAEFVVPLVKAVQELDSKIEKQQEIINELQKENNELKKLQQEIEEIKANMKAFKK